MQTKMILRPLHTRCVLKHPQPNLRADEIKLSFTPSNQSTNQSLVIVCTQATSTRDQQKSRAFCSRIHWSAEYLILQSDKNTFEEKKKSVFNARRS